MRIGVDEFRLLDCIARLDSAIALTLDRVTTLF